MSKPAPLSNLYDVFVSNVSGNPPVMSFAFSESFDSGMKMTRRPTGHGLVANMAVHLRYVFVASNLYFKLFLTLHAWHLTFSLTLQAFTLTMHAVLLSFSFNLQAFALVLHATFLTPS